MNDLRDMLFERLALGEVPDRTVQARPSPTKCAFDVVAPAWIEQINGVSIDPELGAFFSRVERQCPRQSAIELGKSTASERDVQIQYGLTNARTGNPFHPATILRR